MSFHPSVKICEQCIYQTWKTIDKIMFPDRKYLVPVFQPKSQEEKMVCRWREDRSRRRKKMN